MENKCTACGFVNPEGVGFCSLCGIPFIPSIKGTVTSAAPGGAEDDPQIAQRHQEAVLKDLERLAPPTGTETGDELESIISDFDGTPSKPVVRTSGETPRPPAPPAPRRDK
jgi:hypothetical protein